MSLGINFFIILSQYYLFVIKVINKQNDSCFTANDEKVFSSYLQFCGIGLRNAQLYEKSQLEVKRNQVITYELLIVSVPRSRFVINLFNFHKTAYLVTVQFSDDILFSLDET